MLTKILVTALVIVAVLTFYRVKNAARPELAVQRARAANNRFGRMMAYGFAGFLVLVSAIWFGLHWREQHRIITIRVIGDSGPTVYKAYNKDLKGNHFETIDGRKVILGESERVEIIGAQ